ncbi:DUF4124 domain-containing protein [Ramlibacter sp. USB13]|uniref:DUF4124 domain-containing protein n=1 Tax=Ramlibacter cellulosilyticus TaxID=2764187 RepID=A0A923MPX0_9BURK|nr:DUF4124 domain-containing protein [Ramlibacter cellulosilyticus]MBC5782044.1 DUF4124 domain-containing protein [Ramlibacter cellulosilyticus]
MDKSIVGILACAAALAGPAAHAQNKCVENGRTTYQEAPCPGTARSETIQSPSAVRTAPSPAPRNGAAAAPPRPSAGRDPMELRKEASEMESCAGDWDIQAGTMRSQREAMERSRARGRSTASDEVVATTQMQRFVARFLPKCGKFGFVAPTDAASEQLDIGIAQELWRKHDAKLAEIEAAGRAETAARSRASEQQGRADLARDCMKARREIADAFAQNMRLPADQRAPGERAIAQAQREVERECSR